MKQPMEGQRFIEKLIERILISLNTNIKCFLSYYSIQDKNVEVQVPYLKIILVICYEIYSVSQKIDITINGINNFFDSVHI